MKDYSNLTAVEFVQEDHFVKWAKHPGLYPELDRFWTSWLERHPFKIEEIEEAKRLIAAIAEEGESVQMIKHEEEVWEKLQSSIRNKDIAGKREKSWSNGMAASLLILISASALVWWIIAVEKTPSSRINGITEITNVANEGIEPKTILLTDGSSIILQPKSTISYPRVFQSDIREVTLTGEGFFEIAKDRQRPFIVYADKLITKVLGTTFTIRAFDNEMNVLVQVKTGKVSVFTAEDAEENKNKTDSKLEGVLLIPNQQVIFSRKEARLLKSLIENPTVLNPTVKTSFVFRDVPLKRVFDAIEQAYGVDIVYDEELMNDCSLNASLEDMPLYEKIRLICKTVEAQYEVLDSHIVITGKGCN